MPTLFFMGQTNPMGENVIHPRFPFPKILELAHRALALWLVLGLEPKDPPHFCRWRSFGVLTVGGKEAPKPYRVVRSLHGMAPAN